MPERRMMGLFGQLKIENVKKMEVRRDVEGLIKALTYQKSELVRLEAVVALAKIGDADAVDPLCCTLRFGEGKMRQLAAGALGTIGDPRAVKALISGLGEEGDISMHQECAEALGKIGSHAVSPLIDVLLRGNLGDRKTAAEVLTKMGSPGISPLVDVLLSGDWREREAAAEALRRIGAPAVEALVERLRNSDRSSDGALAEVLGEIGDVRAVQPLIDVLNRYGMSKSAVIALGKLRDIRAVGPLITKLGSFGQPAEAAEALGLIGDARAVKPLVALLQDGLWEPQIAAAKALDKIGWQPGNTEIGAKYFAFKGDWVRCAEVGPRAVPLLITLIKQCQFSDEAAEALGNIGAPAVAPLMGVLGAEDLNSHIVHKAAKHALAKIGVPAVAALIATLKDGNERQRQRAAGALDEMRWQPGKDEMGAVYWIYKNQWERCAEIGASAVGPLIAVLTDRDSPVRPAAAQALGKIGDPGSVDALIAALTDSNNAVCSAAAEALGRLGDDRCKDALVAALEVPWACVNAAIVLGKMGDARAVDVLIASFNENLTAYEYYSNLRKAEEEALVKVGAPAVEPLITLLNDGSEYARPSAARALGQIGDPRAVDALVTALDLRGWTTCVEAAVALEKIGWRPGNDEIGVRYWLAHKSWEKCVEIGAISVEPIWALIKSYPYIAGVDSVKALVQIGGPRVVEPLIAALDGDWETEKAAFEALGQIGDARAVEPLIANLSNSLRSRQAAARSLVRLYRSGPLDEAYKHLILTQRDRITEPVREVYDDWNDNPGPHDVLGIGVAFPV
jgi:HEAT repeat protein